MSPKSIATSVPSNSISYPPGEPCTSMRFLNGWSLSLLNFILCSQTILHWNVYFTRTQYCILYLLVTYWIQTNVEKPIRAYDELHEDTETYTWYYYCTVLAISLDPTSNCKGAYKCLSLNTGIFIIKNNGHHYLLFPVTKQRLNHSIYMTDSHINFNSVVEKDILLRITYRPTNVSMIIIGFQ